MNENENMVERIKELIERLGITQKSFAARIGFGESNLSDILRGIRKPSDAVVHRILENIPNLNPQWMRSGEGSMFIDREVSEEQNIVMELINVFKEQSRANKALMDQNNTLVAQLVMMCNDQRETSHRLIKLYDEMREMQEKHSERSREHLDESLAELKALRKETFERIRELHESTTKMYQEGKEEVLNTCKTFDVEDYEKRKGEL